MCVYSGGVAGPGFSLTARPDAGAMEEYAREPWYGDGHRPRDCCRGATASWGRRAGEVLAPPRHVPDSGDSETFVVSFRSPSFVPPTRAPLRGATGMCLEKMLCRTNHSTFPSTPYLPSASLLTKRDTRAESIAAEGWRGVERKSPGWPRVAFLPSLELLGAGPG